MRKLLVASLGICVLAVTAMPLLAAGPDTGLALGKAQRYFATGGRVLTDPSNESGLNVSGDFLRGRGHSDAAVASMRVETEGPGADGLTHLRISQQVGGLTVYGAYVRAAVNGQGQLVQMLDNLAGVPRGGVSPASVGAPQALGAALDSLFPGRSFDLAEAGSNGNAVSYAGGDFFFSDPTVTRMALPLAGGRMAEGFLVETWTHSDNLLYHTVVDGRGRVIDSQLRTAQDSYNVFTNDPDKTPQGVVNGPGAGNNESPIGWLTGGQTTVNISGNNVNAYLDTDANNSPDAGGSAVGDGNFLTSANLSQSPATNQNKAVAVQNLFYLNNVLHDKLYSHGFVESAGNFQQDNFGNGGNGGDPVLAEAQDGSGTNNANFSTPNDGSNGRMQMFVWTTANPNRDGDIDSDIVYHEYGHGLTWRMIGNMSGAMSGAIGEGMSDAVAILINGDDRLAEYSFNDPGGIRSAPYTNYPRTYGDFGGNSVHSDGEIIAAIHWRLGELYDDAGISRDTLFDDVIGGMNFTPSGPAFEDMRDGALQAASGSGRECLIWEAYAAYGVGEGAQGQVKGGGPFGGNVTITESFTLPSQCSGSCTPDEDPEVSCGDGQDNDCDGLTDGDDPDCGGGTCTDGQVGDACVDDSDCCSNKCKGPSGGKTCK